MLAANYAYSLSQDELGWRWRLYDEDGEVVGAGRKETQAAAEAEIKRAISAVSYSSPARPAAVGKRLVDPPSVVSGAAIGVCVADR